MHEPPELRIVSKTVFAPVALCNMTDGVEIRAGIIFVRINTNFVPIKCGQGQRRICQTQYAQLGCPWWGSYIQWYGVQRRIRRDSTGNAEQKAATDTRATSGRSQSQMGANYIYVIYWPGMSTCMNVCVFLFGSINMTIIILQWHNENIKALMNPGRLLEFNNL